MKRISTATFAMGLMMLAGQAMGFTLSNTPLFVTGNVDPNIVLTLDDSGSMRRAFVPEHCGDSSDCAALDNRWAKSARANALYYNPDVIYTPPKNANGTSRTTSFSSAWRNGLYISGTEGGINFGTAVNLLTGYLPTAYLDMGISPPEAFMGHYASDLAALGVANANTAGPAYYYVFDSSNSNCTATDKKDNDCYDLVKVNSTSGPGTKDINGDGSINASDKDERQNFANWYSFYRTRMLATASGASLAFSDLALTTRVSWQALNTCRGSTTSLVDTDCDGWKDNFSGKSNAINSFTNATHKQDFFDWLFQVPTNSGTPLREAMIRAGEYFSTSGEGSPYDNNFSTAASGEYSCRRNFHILMTDGIWNDTTPASIGGNVDNTSVGALPDDPTGTAYDPAQTYARLYKDSTSNTLADVAFKYWKTDLRGGLTDNLTPVQSEVDSDGNNLRDSAQQIFWNAKNDPATWQHMVNFTIGLGLTDFLAAGGLTWTGDMYAGSYQSIKDGTQTWPAATAQSGTDANYGTSAFDLWHAAINSRGKFFSVEAPDQMVNAFQIIMATVKAATPTSAALAANSTKAEIGTRVYQAKFDTAKWNGHLYAYDVNPADGSLSPAAWDAATQVPAHASRNVYIRNASGGAAFQWANLTCTQKTYLNNTTTSACPTTPGVGDGNGSLRVDWLRGDTSHEQRFSGGIFRNREVKSYEKANPSDPGFWVLGDIISSDPEYVGTGSQNYDGLATGGTSYASFVTYKSTRTPAIYVGANDGMLHAFRADTGAELFAVIPSAVFPNLDELTSTGYSHLFSVDGSPSSGDAYLNNTLSHASGWNTVVVAGLGGGGNSVIAVDATSTSSTSASRFMWEYTDTDMGYTYSQPQVAKLNDGSWAAVFGNGYKTSGGGAYLYVVNLADGTLIKKIQAGSDANNGLSTPMLLDTNNDKIMDTAYAGDLQGNMWKFDLSSGTATSWGLANGGTPLFIAKDASGNRQPITVQPSVANETTSGGYWVFFGTGRFLASEDVQTAEMAKTQSFYGIWDNGAAVPTYTARTEWLVAQTVTDTLTSNGKTVRVTSDSPVTLSTSVRGWYMDLPGAGERVVSEAVTVISNVNPAENRVVFVTVLPSSDPCNSGGDSYLMEPLFNGRRPATPVFDLNNDGTFGAGDMVTVTINGVATLVPVTGVKSTVGIMDTPTWLDKDAGIAFKLAPGTSGGVETIKNKGKGASGTTTRVFWQQLM